MRASTDACKQRPTDGLLLLIADEVRKILLPQMNNKGKPTGIHYQIDVIHRPVELDNPQRLPENPAHSQIESTPDLNGSRFNKLKEALARLAEKHGWLVKPS